MPPLSQPLALPPAQLATLRSAMRDLQVSIGDYYRRSEGSGVEAEVLATPARSSIGFVRVLNELFRKQTSRTAEYCAIFEPPMGLQAELIQAFEYLRHVTQHIDPVHPQSAVTVGGAGLEFRTYATWKEVPSSVHERLTSSTKTLKPIYERNLQGQEVVGTLLNAAGSSPKCAPTSFIAKPMESGLASRCVIRRACRSASTPRSPRIRSLRLHGWRGGVRAGTFALSAAASPTPREVRSCLG